MKENNTVPVFSLNTCKCVTILVKMDLLTFRVNRKHRQIFQPIITRRDKRIVLINFKFEKVLFHEPSDVQILRKNHKYKNNFGRDF